MNIIVTGASRGVGYALVRELSRNPEDRILAVSRNVGKLNGLQRVCLSENPDAQVFPLSYDLTEPLMDSGLVEAIEQITNRIDILVNNAGLLIHKPFQEFNEADIDQVFQVNFKAVVLLIQALLPMMSPGAHILNIGSMGGYQGSVKFPGMSLYSASKGALAVLTECLAEEFKSRNISVNMLALGAVDTEMLRIAFPGYMAPLSADEAASFIGYFARTGQRFFNGKILPLSVSTP